MKVNLPIKKPLSTLLLLVGLILPFSAAAGDLALLLGTSTTLKDTPLLGITGGFGIRTNASDGKFSETQLLSHVMTGISLGEDDEGIDSGKTIFMNSMEFSWSRLYGSPDGYYWGPGIGYGVAEVKTENKSNVTGYRDSNPFFTDTDIHYGILTLSFGQSWSNTTCEARFSSFGGLIGGSLLCGILY